MKMKKNPVLGIYFNIKKQYLTKKHYSRGEATPLDDFFTRIARFL
jgi:hypothetical protein